MAWVRLDEDFATHPKVLDAGPLGLAMQVAALCYCNRHLTDGRITLAAVRTLIDLDGIHSWDGHEVTADHVVKDLVNAGMWHETGHDCPQCPPIERGYVIHGYLDLQPSRAQVEAKKEQASEAGRRGGLAKAKRTAKRTASEPLSETSSERLAKVCPDPDTDTHNNNHVELASPDPTLVEVPDPVVEVFNAWCTATGHTRSKLSPERRKLIRKWLKVGYTVEELIDACRGITRSKFHMGDNDRHTVYDDLKVVLKDAGNIDKFIGYERDGATIEEPTPWA